MVAGEEDGRFPDVDRNALEGVRGLTLVSACGGTGLASLLPVFAVLCGRMIFAGVPRGTSLAAATAARLPGPPWSAGRAVPLSGAPPAAGRRLERLDDGWWTDLVWSEGPAAAIARGTTAASVGVLVLPGAVGGSGRTDASVWAPLVGERLAARGLVVGGGPRLLGAVEALATGQRLVPVGRLRGKGRAVPVHALDLA